MISILKKAACAAFATLILAGCATLRAPPPQPVRVPEVLEMSRSGVPAADIIAKMRESGTVYRLQASQLANLRQQGVAPEVIDYMQETYLEAVRRDTRYQEWRHWSRFDDYWYGGVPFGWPHHRVHFIRQTRRGGPHRR